VKIVVFAAIPLKPKRPDHSPERLADTYFAKVVCPT